MQPGNAVLFEYLLAEIDGEDSVRGGATVDDVERSVGRRSGDPGAAFPADLGRNE